MEKTLVEKLFGDEPIGKEFGVQTVNYDPDGEGTFEGVVVRHTDTTITLQCSTREELFETFNAFQIVIVSRVEGEGGHQ